jgi:beta-lactamase class D
MRKLLIALFSLVVLFSACSSNNVKEDDSLQHFFDSAGVKGCFALYDNGQGSFTIYNLSRYRDSAYPPGNTFDILSSLVAFQTGVINNDKSMFQVADSTAADTSHATQGAGLKVSISISQAFKSTGMVNTEVFRKVADSLGGDSLRRWVDSLHYGNQAIDKDPAALYDAELKIPADEQLGLIKRLYFNQLPFFRPTQEMVRDMMNKEATTNYKLVYKSGRVLYKDHVMGWTMGWVEENKHPYFFVANFDSPNVRSDVDKIGIQLVKNILSSMGFLQGKK